MDKIIMVEHVIRNLKKIDTQLNEDIYELSCLDVVKKAEATHAVSKKMDPIYETLNQLGGTMILITNRVRPRTLIQEAKPFVLEYYMNALEAVGRVIDCFQELETFEPLVEIKHLLKEKRELFEAMKADAEMAAQEILPVAE